MVHDEQMVRDVVNLDSPGAEGLHRRDERAALLLVRGAEDQGKRGTEETGALVET